ncbi:MAG: efflux RND transporter periplasmic adaptor subunit [Thermoanaerobaculia bacterium]
MLSLFLIAAVGCGKSAPDEAAAATPAPEPAATPELPADVRDVAAVAKPEATPQAAKGEETAEGTVTATGELVAPVTSEVAVRMPGRVGKVFADEGERVRRGQPLLTLETEYLSLELKRADAEVARAKASAADAERDFMRKEELIAKGSVARAAYDRSQSAYEAARAGVAAAEAARDLARQRLADAVLHSPISGVVAERRADAGERLGDSSVAYVIVQTSPLKLRFQLPERYLARVKRGQAVRATVDPYPGRTFTGKVSVIGGVVDPATRTVAVETEFSNADGRLSPGLFARVELDLGPTVEG